jgi:hypothetical protein
MDKIIITGAVPHLSLPPCFLAVLLLQRLPPLPEVLLPQLLSWLIIPSITFPSLLVQACPAFLSRTAPFPPQSLGFC